MLSLALASTEPEKTLSVLRRLVEQGGPNRTEYDALSNAFNSLQALGVPHEAVRACVFPLLNTLNCLQGFGYQKPHGYGSVCRFSCVHDLQGIGVRASGVNR